MIRCALVRGGWIVLVLLVNATVKADESDCRGGQQLVEGQLVIHVLFPYISGPNCEDVNLYRRQLETAAVWAANRVNNLSILEEISIGIRSYPLCTSSASLSTVVTTQAFTDSRDSGCLSGRFLGFVIPPLPRYAVDLLSSLPVSMATVGDTGGSSLAQTLVELAVSLGWATVSIVTDDRGEKAAALVEEAEYRGLCITAWITVTGRQLEAFSELSSLPDDLRIIGLFDVSQLNIRQLQGQQRWVLGLRATQQLPAVPEGALVTFDTATEIHDLTEALRTEQETRSGNTLRTTRSSSSTLDKIENRAKTEKLTSTLPVEWKKYSTSPGTTSSEEVTYDTIDIKDATRAPNTNQATIPIDSNPTEPIHTYTENIIADAEATNATTENEFMINKLNVSNTVRYTDTTERTQNVSTATVLLTYSGQSSPHYSTSTDQTFNIEELTTATPALDNRNPLRATRDTTSLNMGTTANYDKGPTISDDFSSSSITQVTKPGENKSTNEMTKSSNQTKIQESNVVSRTSLSTENTTLQSPLSAVRNASESPINGPLFHEEPLPASILPTPSALSGCFGDSCTPFVSNPAAVRVVRAVYNYAHAAGRELQRLCPPPTLCNATAVLLSSDKRLLYSDTEDEFIAALHLTLSPENHTVYRVMGAGAVEAIGWKSGMRHRLSLEPLERDPPPSGGPGTCPVLFTEPVRWHVSVWTTVLATLAAVGGVACLCFLLFYTFISWRPVEHRQGWMALLIVAILWQYVATVPFLLTQGRSMCQLRLHAPAIGLAAPLAVMLSRAVALTAAQTARGTFGHISGALQTALCFFILLVQLGVSGAEWVALKMDAPEGTAAAGTAHPSQCEHSRDRQLISLSYVALLQVLHLLLSPWVAICGRNYCEGPLSAAASWLSALVWTGALTLYCLDFRLLDSTDAASYLCLGLIVSGAVQLWVLHVPRLLLLTRAVGEAAGVPPYLHRYDGRTQSTAGLSGILQLRSPRRRRSTLCEAVGPQVADTYDPPSRDTSPPQRSPPPRAGPAHVNRAFSLDEDGYNPDDAETASAHSRDKYPTTEM